MEFIPTQFSQAFLLGASMHLSMHVCSYAKDVQREIAHNFFFFQFQHESSQQLLCG
jgi:hypothetical protein